MPGVTITTAVRTGPTSTGIAPASTFFVVGQTARGIDNAAVLVTSLEDYESKFGGHVTGHYTWYSLKTFFEEGGSNAYVARVVDLDADSAFVSLPAPSAEPGIKLVAVGRGTWANEMDAVVVETGGVFSISVTISGTEVYSGSGFTKISEAISSINFSSTARYYFTAQLNPGADEDGILSDASLPFVDGEDGTVAQADFISTMSLFTEDLGAGAVAVPGAVTGTGDATLWDAMKSHCIAYNRIALCSFAQATLPSAAVSAAEAYSGNEYMAFFYPWVKVPVNETGTVTVNISPEGYVAAARSRTHNGTGPWKAYAGLASEANFVSDTVQAISRSEGDTLEAAKINPLRVINGRVRIYGARSMSANLAQWRFITHRETINYIVTQANTSLESLVFSNIDGRKTIYANIVNALQSVMEPIRIAGGLYEGFAADGRQIDYGYTIKVDDSLNPLSQLETGTVRAKLGVRVSGVGDKINVELIKSNLTTTLA